MARPTKQGIDYFPVDVQWDEKVELFIAETGADGLGVLMTIWQLIYQNEGYYVNNNSDLPLLVRRRVMANIDRVKEIIKVAIERGVFDRYKARQYKILTSKAIQKRYFSAAKKKKTISVNQNYLCKCVSVTENVCFSSGNATKEEVEEKEEVKVKEETMVLDFLNEKAKKKFKHTESNLEPIIARLGEGYSVDDCKKVVTNQIVDPYFVDNPKFLRPETLFRKSKFAGYLENTPSGSSKSCDTCDYKKRGDCDKEKDNCTAWRPVA